MNFTELEIEWLIEECEMRQSVCMCNLDNEGMGVFGLYNSMQNVIDKIKK